MKQGSILIYSLMMMSVILAVGIGMNAIFLRNLQNVRQARDSVTALYVADSGTELCLYEARSGTDSDIVLPPEATLAIKNIADGADVTSSCVSIASISFGFRATGTFRDASRALEISQ